MVYRYNIVIEMGIDTDGLSKGKSEVKSQLRGYEKEVIDSQRRINDTVGQTSRETQRNLKATDDALGRSRTQLGMWGTAFKGAFVGAVAGIVFSTIVTGIFSINRALIEGGIASVRYAADLEQTTNALAVFTGSTRSARIELADIDKTARETTGLRMIPAEEGFQRLRALGFQAKLSKGFIKELGEEKILSGASDEALGKIIFNFAQIASGGQKVSQELREIVTQMPTLQRAFFEAFGTLDPKKIQKFFDEDKEQAFQRLVDAMARGKQATGGLNDAIGKLADEFIVAGRAFGEPFLEPVTRDVRDLTTFLRENADVWSEWGKAVSDAYRGAGAAARFFKEGGGYKPADPSFDILSTVGLGGYHLLQDIGRIQREREETERANRSRTSGDISSLNRSSVNTFLRPDGTLAFQTAEELDTARLNAEKVRMEFEEKTRQLRFGQIESEKKRELVITDNFYRESEARLQAHLDLTLEQERNTASVLSRNKLNEIVERGNLIKKYHNETLKYGNLSADEELKLENETNAELLKLETDFSVEVFNQRKRDLEFERRIIEQRRQAQIEFLNLQTRASQQAYERQIADTERFIQKVGSISGEGYAELIRLTNESYLRIYEYTRETYGVRLLDEKLGNQERINLQKEMNLELQRLEEDNRQKILQIQERQYQNQLERLDRFADEFSRRVGNATSQISAVSGSLSVGGIDSQLVKNIGQSFFGGDIDKLLADTEFKLNTARQVADNVGQAVGSLDPASDRYRDLKLRLELVGKEIEYHKKSIDDLNNKYPLWLTNIYRTTKGYQDGTVSLEQFQRAQIDLFDRQTTAGIIDFNNRIDSLNEKIAKAAGAGNQSDLARFRGELENLITEKTLFSFDAANERAELFNKTIEGLTEKLKRYREADPNTVRQLNDVFRGESLQQQKTQYEEIYRLKYQIANSPYIDSLEVEKAYLEDIIELRGQETEAVIRSNRAKLEIADKFVYSKNRADADVAEFLASQKGITDILSETRINIITQAFNGLDAVAMSLSKNFGFAKDAVQQLISSLLRLVAIPLIQKAFGIGGGVGTGGQGGIPGLNIPGVGGQGGFGTPGFNPNLQQFINPAYGGFNQPVNVGGGNITFDSNNYNGGIRAGLQGGGVATGGGIRGIFGQLQGILPLLGAGLGSQLGGGSGAGGILGGVGGGILGLVGGAFGSSSTAFGGLFGSLGGLLGLSGAATLGIGAAVGGAIMLGAYFLGRNSQRRKDERVRDKAMVDALGAIDKLITDVKNDKIDGDSALSQAEQIRDQYVEQMSALKSKKTRQIALKDVSRIDAKISELKSAIAGQVSRRERLEMLVPTFGEGGQLSNFTRRNYRENPLGYRNEPESIGYFRYNEKGSEYILDHETTRNVGTYHLDNLRATKGESFKSMLRNTETSMPSRATGGALTQTTSTPTNTSGSSVVDVQVIINGSIIPANEMADAITVLLKHADGTTTIKKVTQEMKTDGQEFVTVLIDLLRQKGVKV